MSTWLSEREMKEVAPAEIAAFRSPVPTQVVSNGSITRCPKRRTNSGSRRGSWNWPITTGASWEWAGASS